MSRFLSVLTFFVLALVFASCHDEVLTQGSAQPTIDLEGKDCYDFGSLLAGSTSSTRKLLVQNKNNGVLELQSIVLRGGADSPFKINVDGMAGTSFTRPELLHIAQGDSLFILLEVTAPKKQEQREYALEDFLDISCNGHVTSIRLLALSLGVEQLRDFTLTEDLRWDASGCDKQIFGTLTIPEGCSLTIADSTTLFMHDQSRIEVFGQLIIAGSTDHPVTLIGDRTDKMFDNLYYRDMGGQWDGIHYQNTNGDNLIEYADIKGMVEGITADGARLVVRNTILKNSNQSLVRATASEITIENSCLMNSGEALVDLTGGIADITHCTLANYQFWTHYPEHDFILRNCQSKITNSIIYGNSAGPNVELEYEKETSVPYFFDHCLLNAKGGDDEHFIATIWGEDPLYVLVDMPNYLCDPHLQAESPAKGKGTSSTLNKIPLDLDGKPRAEKPSIGCYE